MRVRFPPRSQKDNMSLFSKQKVFCMACGKEHETTFFVYGGEVCSDKCSKEIQWRKTLSILGKEYFPLSPGEVTGKPG